MAISKLMGLLLCLPAAWASDLVFPSAVERTGEVAGVYRMNSRATGKGQLAIRWRDVYGRVIEDRKIPIELNDETEIGFTLDIHSGVAMKNTIEAHLNLDGVNKRGAGAYRPGLDCARKYRVRTGHARGHTRPACGSNRPGRPFRGALLRESAGGVRACRILIAAGPKRCRGCLGASHP
jgi:hypothetical protein